MKPRRLRPPPYGWSTQMPADPVHVMPHGSLTEIPEALAGPIPGKNRLEVERDEARRIADGFAASCHPSDVPWWMSDAYDAWLARSWKDAS